MATCKKVHSTQDLIQEAFSIHFNSMESEDCEYCKFEISEIHYIDVKCLHCCDQSWLFTLKNNNEENSSWTLKLDSYNIEGFDHSSDDYKGKQREFTITIDPDKSPEYHCIETIREDIIYTGECQHSYLKKVAKQITPMILECPACQGFDSTMKLGGRSRLECHHEYLIAIDKNYAAGATCPKCNNFIDNS